tara:strand:+ start:106 stop:507 length:402 start_codon:yes stop_codon:yes gene_type:complete
MRLKDITEAKKKPEPNKPRDPNWRDMEALRKSGAAGTHKDKTKTIPRKEKHKQLSLEDRLQQYMKETATAGATVSASIATVASPHLAIGDKKTRKKYGLMGGLPNPPKAKAQKPTDNALNMKGTSIFGGPLKR